jgi:hypothetical protein
MSKAIRRHLSLSSQLPQRANSRLLTTTVALVVLGFALSSHVYLDSEVVLEATRGKQSYNNQ